MRKVTHRTKSNGGGGKTNEATIPGVRLMNSISIVIAKLLKNIVNFLIVLQDH